MKYGFGVWLAFLVSDFFVGDSITSINDPVLRSIISVIFNPWFTLAVGVAILVFLFTRKSP